MRILIITDDFPPRSFGGAGIIAYGHARELVKRGHEVFIITTVQDAALEGTSKQEGFQLHNIYIDYPVRWRAYVSLYNPVAVRKVKKLIEVIQPEIVHIHNVHSYLSYKTIEVAKRYVRKVFVTAHDTMYVRMGKLRPAMEVIGGRRVFDYHVTLLEQFKEFKWRVNPLSKPIIKHYLSYADKIFSVSGALKEAIRQNGIDGLEVMHNGINSENFSADENKVGEFKHKYQLKGKKVLFFGGRMSRAKGGDAALDLLEELVKTEPDVCLLMIGKGEGYIERLKERARNAGLANNVRFIDWLGREEIIPAYYASDIVLTLSIYMDPFPTVNLEAMAAKKPVIGTCFGGTPEAVRDKVNGFVVDPNDISILAERTKELLNSFELSREFGDAGFELAKGPFSLTRQIDLLETEYRK